MIDGRAIVDTDVVLGENVTIGPWSLIGPGVGTGRRCSYRIACRTQGPCKNRRWGKNISVRKRSVKIPLHLPLPEKKPIWKLVKTLSFGKG